VTTPYDRAERQLARHGFDVGALPRVGDGVRRQVSFLEAYSELVAVSLARAEFLGALLAEQIADAQRPTEGLVYTQHAFQGVDEDGGQQLAEIGEDIRALVKAEADERDRAARLIRDAIKIGVQIHQAEAMRSYGATIAASLQAFARELGLNEHSPEVNRAAARAVLVARRAVGQDEGDPDRVGPALTADERARVLAGG
jgi:hypothetical protein